MSLALDAIITTIAENINSNLKYFSIPCYDSNSFHKILSSYKQRFVITEHYIDWSYFNLTALNFENETVIIRNITAISYYDNNIKTDTLTIILLLAQV